MPRRTTLALGLALVIAAGGGRAAAVGSAGPGRDAAAPGGASNEYDLLIEHGRIIDGTGSPWYAGDVAIRSGRIAAIGRLPGARAKRVIDAHGLVVAPGFIDMLGQSELTMLVDPRVPSKIYQGITTEITGEGESVAPLDEAMIAQHRTTYAHYGLTPDWRTLSGYFARLRRQGLGINLGTYVGATSVREMVVGYGDRRATPAEIVRMQALVADSMREGALGLSTALEYAPAPYASTDELIALARTAASYGGIYATHMRSEGDTENRALDETFRIAREAQIPVEIFHLKVAGSPNWGTAAHLLARIDAARASGLDVAADTYAYTAWENTLSAFIPPWAHDGGTEQLIARLKDPATRVRIRREMISPTTNWDDEWHEIRTPADILVTTVARRELAQYQGKRISEIAKAWHEDPIDAICDLLIKDDAGTEVAVFGMSEPDVETVLKAPWVSIDNDASGTSPDGLLGRDHEHPRAYGTFPRILRKYVREQHQLTLPDAIRKFTALAAQREHLADRGVLKAGMWADVVVFDPQTIRDTSTYADPNRFAAGMRYVLVNGVEVIDHGKMTGALPGQVILGPGYRK